MNTNTRQEYLLKRNAVLKLGDRWNGQYSSGEIVAFDIGKTPDERDPKGKLDYYRDGVDPVAGLTPIPNYIPLQAGDVYLIKGGSDKLYTVGNADAGRTTLECDRRDRLEYFRRGPLPVTPKIEFVREERDCESNRNNRKHQADEKRALKPGQRASWNDRNFIWDYRVMIDGEYRARLEQKVGNKTRFELVDVDCEAIRYRDGAYTGLDVRFPKNFMGLIVKYLHRIPTMEVYAARAAKSQTDAEKMKAEYRERAIKERIEKAAPDMLEALLYVAEFASGGEKSWGDKKMIARAIAKARGHGERIELDEAVSIGDHWYQFVTNTSGVITDKDDGRKPGEIDPNQRMKFYRKLAK